jgi:hypothetical protein
MRLSDKVTNEQFNRIIQIESAGNPDAGPPKGSAAGLGQFIIDTWNRTGKKYFPALVRRFGAAWAGMRRGKKTATLQLLMLARFTEDNVRALGAGWGDGELYMAHFLGIGDARNVFRADPSDRVEKHVTPKAVENNHSILAGKTCAQVRAWAASSMKNRWDKAGRPDHVTKWYNAKEAAIYTGTTHEDDLPEDDEQTPIKVEPHDQTDDAPADPHRDTPPVNPSQPGVQGDPDTWLIQSMLKNMNYPPGKIDGHWGGMTAEALAGFINDRNGHAIHQMTPPGSNSQFEAVKDEIKEELEAAQNEGFRRPVSEERANPTKKKVDEVAPEAAPVRRNFLLTVWSAISAFAMSVYTTVSDWIGDIWNFFTDNEDKVPDGVKDPSWLWSHLASVPPGVWFGLIALVLGFIAYNSRSALHKMVDDIKTGVRK